jgi:broad specificity phosphatase PhoE
MHSVQLLWLLLSTSFFFITVLSFSPLHSSLSSYYISSARSRVEKVKAVVSTAATTASISGDPLRATLNTTVAQNPTEMFTNPIVLAPLSQQEANSIMSVAEKEQHCNGDFGSTAALVSTTATISTSSDTTASEDTTTTKSNKTTTTAIIYGVRHACSIANEYLKQKGNEWGDATFRDDLMLRDARLSDKGFAQADKLSQRLLRELKESSSSTSNNDDNDHWLNQIELVVVSPLTRCLQTWERACRPALVAALEASKKQHQNTISSLTSTATTTNQSSSFSSSLSSLSSPGDDDTEKSESSTSQLPPTRRIRRKPLPVKVIVLPLASERVYTAGETGSSVQELQREFADGTSSATPKTDTMVTDWSAFDDYYNNSPWWYHENDDNNDDEDENKGIKNKCDHEWRPHGQGQYYAVPGEPWDIFDDRMTRFKEWLQQRPEKCILVVSHWGVLNHLTGGQDLKNCGLVRMEI